MNDFLHTAQSGSFNFSSSTDRYIFGPTAELRLPFGLGVEADILYRHFSFTQTNAASAASTINSSSSAWEFPILAKYRFSGKIIHPYIDGGIAWDKISGVTQSISTLSIKDTTTGFVLGGGVSVKVLLIRISPEIRYTRWGAKHFFDLNGGLSSNQNQAEFLVGITF